MSDDRDERPTEPMTDEEMVEARARLAAATPGPWAHDNDYGPLEGMSCAFYPVEGADLIRIARVEVNERHDRGKRNAEFIAHAPTDIDRLLARVEAERAGREAAERRARWWQKAALAREAAMEKAIRNQDEALADLVAAKERADDAERNARDEHTFMARFCEEHAEEVRGDAERDGDSLPCDLCRAEKDERERDEAREECVVLRSGLTYVEVERDEARAEVERLRAEVERRKDAYRALAETALREAGKED